MEIKNTKMAMIKFLRRTCRLPMGPVIFLIRALHEIAIAVRDREFNAAHCMERTNILFAELKKKRWLTDVIGLLIWVTILRLAFK